MVTSCTGKMKTFNCRCFVMSTNSETKLQTCNSRSKNERERKHSHCHVKGAWFSSDIGKRDFYRVNLNAYLHWCTRVFHFLTHIFC